MLLVNIMILKITAALEKAYNSFNLENTTLVVKRDETKF